MLAFVEPCDRWQIWERSCVDKHVLGLDLHLFLCATHSDLNFAWRKEASHTINNADVGLSRKFIVNFLTQEGDDSPLLFNGVAIIALLLCERFEMMTEDDMFSG